MNTNSINAAIMNNQFLKTSNIRSKEQDIKGFACYLNNAISKTNEMIIQADNISNQFAAGKTDDIHKVLIAVEKADIALQFTLQVRNKIIDAYNEIMRMQI
ncbi:MAG TPA: flagellar hook-basal body complex protein FliE [Clostridiaceae bacterium]|jgi:flagellar hook-basal body complex protein FliE|nr:flagellar hook-basal body complex protein FliE [Clostridiaceae bacterium]